MEGSPGLMTHIMQRLSEKFSLPRDPRERYRCKRTKRDRERSSTRRRSAHPRKDVYVGIYVVVTLSTLELGIRSGISGERLIGIRGDRFSKRWRF